MMRTILALLLLLPMTAHATEPLPATVVIAFDRESVTPVIVEGVADRAGEAYGLRSGLWYNPSNGTGIAYFTTAVPPRQSAEDEGGFDQRELALMQRAYARLAQIEAQQSAD